MPHVAMRPLFIIIALLAQPSNSLKKTPTKAQQDDRLRPLDGSCFAFARAGEFWGYEWCHRRWVKQFQAAWAGAHEQFLEKVKNHPPPVEVELPDEA